MMASPPLQLVSVSPDSVSIATSRRPLLGIYLWPMLMLWSLVSGVVHWTGWGKLHLLVRQEIHQPSSSYETQQYFCCVSTAEQFSDQDRRQSAILVGRYLHVHSHLHLTSSLMMFKFFLICCFLLLCLNIYSFQLRGDDAADEWNHIWSLKSVKGYGNDQVWRHLESSPLAQNRCV